jgi:NAD(P)-dependent dehydrogenase (short-subunit alcohol dehydrogenase family)
MANDVLRVLITGSSSGFGKLIVHTLARDGHRVFATMRGVDSRNRAAADEMREWARTSGLSVEVFDLDVTSEESVQDAVSRVLASAGGIDVVVNNAGASAAGPLEAFSMAQIESLFSLNAFGPMRVSQAVLPSMRERGSGLLIFVTSTLGRVLPGRGGLYPATKWAAEGLAESLHYQVKPFGIDVAILEPGSFPTPATSKSMVAEHADIAAAYDAMSPRPQPPRANLSNGSAKQPDPQEVADAVKYLIDLPPGQRPLRTVVGPVFTEGVAEYNEIYERTKAHLAESLRRPDQAITWTPRR